MAFSGGIKNKAEKKFLQHTFANNLVKFNHKLTLLSGLALAFLEVGLCLTLR